MTNLRTSKWKNDLLDKIRKELRTLSGIEQTFKMFDHNNNGKLTSIQFRAALRKIGLWLKSNEID